LLCALAALIAALAPATARAQAPEPRSVLLLLDASKSMNEDAGNGPTRLDAAKAAVNDLVGALPADAQVGLRVYGSEVAESGRRAGCRDTRLVVPVGALDRTAVRERVQALQGRGRTPIGRSLRAAADDLPAAGKRTVILVSDGGDNCAPPDPCRAAEAVAQRGVKLNISVVGLQVNPRVRAQLRCIAKAGGGAYVDAGDAQALRDQLLAAMARAFRDYRPVGTPVQGGLRREAAAPVGPGQYLDSLTPGEGRWYAVRVQPGQRLRTVATVIPGRSITDGGELRVELFDPHGRLISDEMDTVDRPTRVLRGSGTRSLGVQMQPDVREPGVYRFHATLAVEDDPTPWPIELVFEPLAAGQAPPFHSRLGPLSATLGAQGGSAPRPAATPTATAAPRAGDDAPGDNAPALAGAALAGLAVGLVGGGAALRRRGR
jgi:Ca-activated chloride channel family protein